MKWFKQIDNHPSTKKNKLSTNKNTLPRAHSCDLSGAAGVVRSSTTMVGGRRSASGNAAAVFPSAGGRRVSAGAETPRLQWLLNVGFGIGSRSTVGWDGRRVRWAWDKVFGWVLAGNSNSIWGKAVMLKNKHLKGAWHTYPLKGTLFAKHVWKWFGFGLL